MKRIKYFLVFAMLLAGMTVKGQEFNYVHDGSVLIYKILDETAKTCEVVGVEYTSGKVTIPSTVVYEHYADGVTDVYVDYTVTGIGTKSFYDCRDLTEVTIPNTVTTIGDNAFYWCSNLTNISISNSVTSIGNNAFYGCTSLTNIIIPNSVITIGGSAFASCTSLTNITIPNSVTTIGDYAFGNCTSLTDITISNTVKTIGKSAFYGCKGLTEIIIPSSVSKLGDYTNGAGDVFNGCANLKKITVSSGNAYYTDIDGILFDKSVTELHKCPEAKSLTEYIIPNSVTNIKNYAFYNCVSLTKVVIPNAVTSIGQLAFSGCINLADVNIPNSVTSIGTSAFNGCSSLVNINIPNSVTSIGNSAFSGCSSLVNINIPNSVTSIGSSAFNGCSSLSEVTMPNSLTQIYGSTFKGCSSLKAITISNTVTRIMDYAFEGCASLTEITLPGLITGVGSRTFYQCTNLKEVYSKNPTPPTSYDAFREIAPDAILYVPKGSETVYAESSYWNKYFSLILTDDLITHYGSKGLTFTLDEPSKTATVSGYIPLLLPAEVVIPSTIKYDNAVKYTVTGIAENVFANSSALKEVTIPASVTHIGDQAFFNCANLQKVHSNNPAPPVNGFGVFISINQYAMLYVPVGSKDDYMATDWGRYFFAVIEEQVSSVDNVEVRRNPLDNVIYTVSGQRVNATDVNTLPAGMYIVNGRKVIINR